MIEIYIKIPDQYTLNTKVEVVPKIGESVWYRGETFKVVDIVHNIPDTYAGYSIEVILE